MRCTTTLNNLVRVTIMLLYMTVVTNSNTCYFYLAQQRFANSLSRPFFPHHCLDHYASRGSIGDSTNTTSSSLCHLHFPIGYMQVFPLGIGELSEFIFGICMGLFIPRAFGAISGDLLNGMEVG